MNISSVGGVRTDISEMLSKLREVSNKTKMFAEDSGLQSGAEISSPKTFAETMSAAKDVFGHVNSLQMESENIKTAYVSGDKSVSMSQVVLASQKSKLAFEGLVTVRNKILDAYKEIMNMPV